MGNKGDCGHWGMGSKGDCGHWGMESKGERGKSGHGKELLNVGIGDTGEWEKPRINRTQVLLFSCATDRASACGCGKAQGGPGQSTVACVCVLVCVCMEFALAADEGDPLALMFCFFSFLFGLQAQWCFSSATYGSMRHASRGEATSLRTSECWGGGGVWSLVFCWSFGRVCGDRSACCLPCALTDPERSGALCFFSWFSRGCEGRA